jgi:hypothetical protein
MRFMHKFSANLKTRWSPRFPFKVETIFVTSYIKVLLFPWYLRKNVTNKCDLQFLFFKKKIMEEKKSWNYYLHNLEGPSTQTIAIKL